MADVWVEIDKRAGDFRVKTGDVNIGGIASTVADAAGFIPGIGNTLEKGIDAIGSVLGRFFGTQKDEVRDVMRRILGDILGTMMPGEVRFIGSAGDVPELKGQYRREDIRRLLKEIRTAVLSDLAPGSDAYIDLRRAFDSITFNDRDSSAQYLVLKFTAGPPSTFDDDPPVHTGDEITKRTTGGNRNGSSQDEPKPQSVVSRTAIGAVLGIGVVGAIVLLAR